MTDGKKYDKIVAYTAGVWLCAFLPLCSIIIAQKSAACKGKGKQTINASARVRIVANDTPNEYRKAVMTHMQIKDVKYGKTERKSYAKYQEILQMPNLLKIQKDSYNWFLNEGLREVFHDVAAITDYTGNLELSFLDYSLDEKPKYTVEECKERDATYAKPIKVRVRLHNKQTGEIKDQEIFMGDFPLMTNGGTFVINGAERVIVSQIVRSPGMYYGDTVDKAEQHIYTATVIPYRGAWLEYETDLQNCFYVRIDKNRKLPITCLIRALGVETDAQIKELFGEDERILATIERDPCKTREESLLEIYRRLRPGEPPTVESSAAYLDALFFDPRRYDVSRVGRYKFNKKMDIWSRLNGQELAEPVADPRTGEILAMPGDVLNRAQAQALSARGVCDAVIMINGKKHKIFSNYMVDMKNFVDFDPKEYGVKEKVCRKVLFEMLDTVPADGWKDAIEERMDDLIPKHITRDDILASINYLNCVACGAGFTDDIDHLGNRRLRCVGELLQNQFRVGFTRLERVIRERMTVQDLDAVTPQSLINIRPVTAVIKEFFGSFPLSQFMDQNNPLAELTHKRRLSALGPGGLSRERASFDVRDVHYSHYGRMCPIETPEGPNIGLINYLTTYAKVNEYGFLETPYRKVEKDGTLTNEIRYMDAAEEYDHVIAQVDEIVDGKLVGDQVVARIAGETVMVSTDEVDYADVSPRQTVSVATACVPFLENDDGHRALMGANMQRQAVPLLNPHSPYVGTGMEYAVGRYSGAACVATAEGTVTYVDARTIITEDDNGKETVYQLTKYDRSNSSTCLNQKPIVWQGERVRPGDILADGPSMENGELALGQNVTVAFMTWHGYNYEDAVIMSERMQSEDFYTSVHIEEYDIECRSTKLGDEEITRDIPNVSESACRNLDSRGIVMVGAEVREGDILVGKVTPKGQSEATPEEKLLLAIFGEKSREVRDNSLKVPHGGAGTVHSVRVFNRKDKDTELAPGVNEVVKVYIVQKRKISEGDKMAGRHGNKGVISKINPVEDMPYMEDGTPIDIMLNPFGVPSRMNIGQVLELHLGMAAKALGVKFATPVFDGVSNEDLRDIMAEAGVSADGKYVLHDGMTGEAYDERISVGVMYMIKLAHMVDDKLHARATGPYSLVTQQPLGGKAQNGGQRFGEMEVWALEGYGAAYTLQEILTVKSDDIMGRTKTYEAIVKGKDLPEPGIPESFRVMVHELQALALDVRMMDDEGNEMDLKQMEQEELKEETTLDMSRQNYVSAAEDIDALTIKDGLEDDLPEEAAVVGVDDMDYGEE